MPVTQRFLVSLRLEFSPSYTPQAILGLSITKPSPDRRFHLFRRPLPSVSNDRWKGAMEFGLLHEFQKSQDTSEAGAFAILRASRRRRAVGLDAMWLAELLT
jgi:hypothetical protein